jgi:hypothetical protein
MGFACRTHGTDEKCKKEMSKILTGRDHLEDLGLDGRIISIRMHLREAGEKAWTGFV